MSQSISPARDLIRRADLAQPLGPEQAGAWLRAFRERADATVSKFTPISPEERFRAFLRFGFRPHGIYLPLDKDRAREVQEHVWNTIGTIPDRDAMLRAYFVFQDETATWEQEGIPGRWTGQMGVARSRARFRVVRWGRRSGKTEVAAHEALAVAVSRPRSVIWCAGPIARTSARVFDIVDQKIKDYQIPTVTHRNTEHEKLIVLKENGARFEGMSLESFNAGAGATVDYAIIDEAAMIEEEMWTRQIEPVLLDRNGQALLISSPQGDETFFDQLERYARDHGNPEMWEAFDGRTSQNFFIAPQGERTPALVEIKRRSDPLDYLEQYGAIPAHARLLVYPEYSDRIIADHCPFDSRHPVILAADPAYGANEYAVTALQDYPALGRANVIAEFYERGALTEDVLDHLEDAPWRGNVTDVVMDSASPAEIQRWCARGWPAYGVVDKPKPRDSYPIVRRLFRDPVKYNLIHQEMLAELMRAKGLDPASYDTLDEMDQRELLVDLEEMLADPLLPDRYIQALKACAYLRFDYACVATRDEHRRLRYPDTQRQIKNVREESRKFKDHTTDCIRMWAWQFHRFDEESAGLRARALTEIGLPEASLLTALHTPEPPPPYEPLFAGRNGFLYEMRRTHDVSRVRKIQLTVRV